MGAKTDIFPTFSELCAIAREVEKKPLSVPARPIDGKLTLDENFGIFPREFEEYTYGFLLIEAQKIERQLNADAISSSSQFPAASARRLTPEQQMQNDLHKFVSTQERASLEGNPGSAASQFPVKKAPSPMVPEPMEVADYERENPKPREAADGGDAPIPGDDEAPLPPLLEKAAPSPPPAKNEMPFPPQAKPRVLPPKMPLAIEQKKVSPPSGAPAPPSNFSPVPPAIQAPIARPSAQASPKIPVSKPAEQDIFEPIAPVPPQASSSNAAAPSSGQAAGAEKKPPAGISSYSKLSPRLQALIEQKLRREEEKVKKAGVDADIFKTPPPPPPDEESGGSEPGKELEDADAPNAWNLHDDAGGESPSEKQTMRDKERKTQPPLPVEDEGEDEALPAPPENEGEESPGEPIGKRQLKMPLRKMDGEIAPIPDEEANPSPLDVDEVPAPEEAAIPREDLAIKPIARREKSPVSPDELGADGIGRGASESQLDENEKQTPAPDVTDEKENMAASARSPSQSGPITIKPMFPDSDGSGPSREISKAEDSDRMRRIQRIIEELSPDKMRAQAQQPQKQEDASFEKDEDEKGQESSEPLPQKAASGKKLKSPVAPLKKAASAQNKKVASLLEKEAQKARQKIAPSAKLQIKAQAEEMPDEKAEEIPIAKSISLRLPAREEESEEQEDQAPLPRAAAAPAPRKLSPRLPVREGESEEQEENQLASRQRKPPANTYAAPAKPFRKLMPRLLPRESEEQEDQAPLPRAAAAPAPRKLSPRLPAREEESDDDEAAAPAPRKLSPRLPAREEESEEQEDQAPLPRAAAAPAPRKLSPRLPVREGESEEQEENQLASRQRKPPANTYAAPAKPFRKLMPRLLPRESEEQEDQAPLPRAAAAPAPRKLSPRLPAREEESEEQEEQSPQPQVSAAKRRVLPGMGRTAPFTPQTYVPPARERKQAPLPPNEPEETGAQDAPDEEPADVSPSIAPLKPKKLVSDESLAAQEKTPVQLLQEQKMAKMAEQLARLEAGKVKEVAGTVAMPVEEEDIPLPDDNEGVPKPTDYEQAKESLRKTLEHDETARKVKQEDETMVEQYAKDHLVWLYEIYKMGGMGREDFLQKASEKYSEVQRAGQAAAGVDKDAPPNPALAALSKEIEKKDKK